MDALLSEFPVFLPPRAELTASFIRVNEERKQTLLNLGPSIKSRMVCVKQTAIASEKGIATRSPSFFVRGEWKIIDPHVPPIRSSLKQAFEHAPPSYRTPAK
jgi:hypothetical protein